jgi:hypothetical protein
MLRRFPYWLMLRHVLGRPSGDSSKSTKGRATKASRKQIEDAAERRVEKFGQGNIEHVSAPVKKTA